MKFHRLPKSALGHGVTTFLCCVQFIGFTGCTTGVKSPDPYDPNNPVGLFANDDLSSDMLGMIRLPTGEMVYVFGTYFENGLIQEVTGAILQNDEGEEASAILENGLVKSGRSFDGSTVEMDYDEVSTRRIKGRADLVFAGLDESDRAQSVTFDIDLQQAAADLADEVRDLLGMDISDSEPPENPLEKSKEYDSAVDGAKSETRSQLILLFAQFHIAAFAALGFAIVEIMTALVGILYEVLVNVIVAVTQAVVVAMFIPFILLGEVMRAAVEQPLYIVDIDIDLRLDTPRHPR